MMASLYQSGSERSARVSGARKCLASSNALLDLLETEDGDRVALRHELLMLPRPRPGPAVSLQQIVEHVGLVGCETEQPERHVDHRVLHMERVEIDHDEHRVRAVLGDLAVEQHLAVVAGMEA